MTYIPNIPKSPSDPRFGHQVEESIRGIYQRYEDLESRHLALVREVEKVRTYPRPENSPQSNRDIASQNVQSFQGQLNQVQYAQIILCLAMLLAEAELKAT